MFFNCETESDVFHLWACLLNSLFCMSASGCKVLLARFTFVLFRSRHGRSAPVSVRRKSEFNIWIITIRYGCNIRRLTHSQLQEERERHRKQIWPV